MPKANQRSIVKKLRPYAILIAVAIVVISKFGARFKEDYFPSTDQQASSSSKVRHVGPFEVLEDCQWVQHKNNDGDSFVVKNKGGEYTIRLYYVDTPEKYISGKYKNQRKRVADQGKYFGGLSSQQAVEVGLKAKAFTEKQLKGKTFTVLTKWESVFSSERYYGFVWLPGSTEKKPLRLCEALVKNGLARIYTKGPGNKREYASGIVQGGAAAEGGKFKAGKGFKKRLYKLQTQAKKAKVGAWGMK
ncbi:MAG: thermonuclease family protein [Verrucomicrobiales bacterium]|nr:thermonuclease family protein [Verrucomicrobiales bacterium]